MTGLTINLYEGTGLWQGSPLVSVREWGYEEAHPPCVHLQVIARIQFGSCREQTQGYMHRTHPVFLIHICDLQFAIAKIFVCKSGMPYTYNTVINRAIY